MRRGLVRYPTAEQIERADILQLRHWLNVLPYPGSRKRRQTVAEMEANIKAEFVLLRRIKARMWEAKHAADRDSTDRQG
jgi:hypothetical protein